MFHIFYDIVVLPTRQRATVQKTHLLKCLWLFDSNIVFILPSIIDFDLKKVY